MYTFLNTCIPTHLTTYPPTYLANRTPSRSNPEDLWPLRHLIRVIRRHDLTKKIPTYQHTYPPTYLPTSLTEHPQRAIRETCDLWDIWSEWWRYMTWPRKYLPTYLPTYLFTYLPTHLPTYLPPLQNTLKEQSQRLVTFETLITILTIENLNPWQSLLSDNQLWHWTAFAILAMFLSPSGDLEAKLFRDIPTRHGDI